MSKWSCSAWMKTWWQWKNDFVDHQNTTLGKITQEEVTEERISYTVKESSRICKIRAIFPIGEALSKGRLLKTIMRQINFKFEETASASLLTHGNFPKSTLNLCSVVKIRVQCGTEFSAVTLSSVRLKTAQEHCSFHLRPCTRTLTDKIDHILAIYPWGENITFIWKFWFWQMHRRTIPNL